MNEQPNRKKDPFFKLIQEAGTEEVHPDFLATILEQLDKKYITKNQAPLISKKSWLIFGLVSIVIALISISQVPSESTWSEIIYTNSFFETPKINLSFNFISLPTFFKTNIMAQAMSSFIVLSFAFIIIRNKLLEWR